MAKNRIESVLTALPVLMLVTGLYIFYSRENAQQENPPLEAEAITLQGLFKGYSEVRSGGRGQHYFWFDVEGVSRGARVTAEQKAMFRADNSLNPGVPIQVKIAPTVSGSKIFWVMEVSRTDNL